MDEEREPEQAHDAGAPGGGEVVAEPVAVETTPHEALASADPAPAGPATAQAGPATAQAGPTTAQAGLAPATRVLLTLAAAVVAIAGFSLGREIIGPFALAAVIVVLVHPVRGVLERRGLPGWLASLAVILSAYLILAAMIALLVLAVQQFVSLIASSSGRIVDLYDSAVTSVSDLGLDLSALGGEAEAFDPASLVGAAGSVVGSITGLAGSFFFILAYVIFMAVDAAKFNHVPTRIADASAPIVASFVGFSHSVRAYFGVNTVFGLIVAVIDGLLLWALDVPGALVWAILAFVTNFIPNVGFVIGLIPAAVFALLFGGWVTAVIVIAAYIVINVVLQTLVQPKFVSDAVHLSLTLTFASVIFWTFVIGAMGALLAVPLTLLVRELLIGTDSTAGFSRWLTSDDPKATAAPRRRGGLPAR
jgi:AI-2 transport protein TqsA